MDQQLSALVEVGQSLRAAGYRFIAPTPATHAIVNARAENRVAKSLTDVFGWSRPFYRNTLPPELLDRLERADAVEVEDNMLKSRVRFASLGDLLLVHSAYPTTDADSVFFGPDTYRFARLLGHASGCHAQDVTRSRRIVDIGCGTGAGGLFIGRGDGTELILTDINDRALAFTKVNAELNGKPDATISYSNILDDVEGPLDLAIANPPYMSDGPTYRDGGALGIEIALHIVTQALEKLAIGGRLILYTGTPIVAGVDAFGDIVAPMLDGHDYTYEEIDPDLFGDELEKAPYARVDRIAAVALSLTRRT
jgi:methylase of polypeptide subunit release factors